VSRHYNRPSIGAYFASLPLPLPSKTQSTSLNIYAFPAFISLVLLIGETAYLGLKLPETKGFEKVEAGGAGVGAGEEKKRRESRQVRRKRLNWLGRVHGGFLLFFSGVSGRLSVSRVMSKLMGGCGCGAEGRVHVDIFE
jgi:hypothetical protein